VAIPFHEITFPALGATGKPHAPGQVSGQDKTLTKTEQHTSSNQQAPGENGQFSPLRAGQHKDTGCGAADLAHNHRLASTEGIGFSPGQTAAKKGGNKLAADRNADHQVIEPKLLLNVKRKGGQRKADRQIREKHGGADTQQCRCRGIHAAHRWACIHNSHLKKSAPAAGKATRARGR
jgi:hypothetical protein